MSQRARGSFVVEVKPVADAEGSVASARLSLAKTFAGELTGESRGDMWTVATVVEGSAGYVAIERFEGTLHGRRGAFTLMHQGTMKSGGSFDLRVIVVPDSGTEELAGLSGTMAIMIAPDGSHTYDFEFD